MNKFLIVLAALLALSGCSSEPRCKELLPGYVNCSAPVRPPIDSEGFYRVSCGHSHVIVRGKDLYKKDHCECLNPVKKSKPECR